MNWAALSHHVVQSIIQISINTSVPFLTQRLWVPQAIRDILVASWQTLNWEDFLDRNIYYKRCTTNPWWSIERLIWFLQEFLATDPVFCGALHERWWHINTTWIETGSCPNKNYNRACLYPEENGLLYAVIAGESILENIKWRESYQFKTQFLETISVDREAARQSNDFWETGIEGVHLDMQRVRDYQRKLAEFWYTYLKKLVQELEWLIDSGAKITLSDIR